ncbi:hypothetical protein QCA50_000593 [Cerrena zonata]|uniref:Uncharacterized protein n=1 Tax=Cerrena zonata TaxID=2478898 RepID=A0AAW0GV84_9APHY
MMAPSAPPPPNMRYPPIMFPEESLPYDEHGNVDWHTAWRTELGNLTRMTEDQEKAGNQEWFRQMWWRLRAMMTHPGDPLMQGMQGAPPPGHPHGMPQQPNPGEVPQE